jgi:hypothetical protein
MDPRNNRSFTTGVIIGVKPYRRLWFLPDVVHPRDAVDHHGGGK